MGRKPKGCSPVFPSKKPLAEGYCKGLGGNILSSGLGIEK